MTPDQPSDPPRQRLDLRGRRLSYTDEGDGPIVLAIHGLPGSVRDWRWLASALDSRVRLIRLDMPGFGDTDVELADPTPEALGDLVIEAAAALELDRFALLAHSFGGSVAVAAAVAVAQASPDRVGALAMLACVGLSPHEGFRNTPNPQAMARMTRMPLVRAAFNPLLRRAFVSSGFPSRTTTPAAVRTIHCVAGFDFPRHAARVAALKCPTLVAWTDDDPFVEPAISTALAAACPDGPRLSYATGGHNLQKTHAVELADALLGFVGNATEV